MLCGLFSRDLDTFEVLLTPLDNDDKSKFDTRERLIVGWTISAESICLGLLLCQTFAGTVVARVLHGHAACKRFCVMIEFGANTCKLEDRERLNEAPSRSRFVCNSIRYLAPVGRY
jgi:hypothetical protein